MRRISASRVAKLALRALATIVAIGNPIAYLAFFHWPSPEAPRWRFQLEWTLVAVSILAMVALIALLAVRAFG